MSNLRSKHAFGSKENVNAALEQGLIDAYDVLFLDEGEFGWINRNGEPVYMPTPEDNTTLKEQVAGLESQVATLEGSVSSIEESFGNYMQKEYEISHKPAGALVDYRDKEIRVMCLSDTKWTLQQSGEGADKNLYYIGFKAYAPSDDIVSFKEDLTEIITDSTMYYFEGNDFAGIDSNGNKYSIVWLPVAVYDEISDTWSYYGANSNSERYIGWYYSVEWYNESGVLVSSDCIRINLTNEECHSSIEPFYLTNKTKELETKIEQAATDATTAANTYTDAQLAAAFTVVEF